MDSCYVTANSFRKVAFTAARLQEGGLHDAMPHVKSFCMGGIPEEHIGDITFLSFYTCSQEI